jgi:Mn2+/Fe2+ NRAMP family transporter
MNKLRNILASIMPGIFLIGYNIGTGSITSMSKAGANFGLDLLWTLAVSCLITYYLINLFSRYTMVTGETIMQGIKKNISPWLAVALIIPLSIIIVSALMGVLGIIASVLEEWSYTAFDTRVSAVWWAMIVSGILYILLLVGNYPIF